MDLDGDGELSSEELKEAMVTRLKRTTTDKEAEELIRLIDRDGDGRVSLVELLQYLQTKRDGQEVEVLEKQMQSSGQLLQKDKSTPS